MMMMLMIVIAPPPLPFMYRSLDRDPHFHGLVTKIGEGHLGMITPKQPGGGGGILGNLMSMLQDGGGGGGGGFPAFPPGLMAGRP